MRASDSFFSADAGEKSLVSVIVVTFRTGPILWECLNAAAAQGHPHEILVVDNGNPPDDQRALDQWVQAHPNARLFRPGRNLGFSAACNWAAASARGDFVALVNPDLILSDNALGQAVAALRKTPDAWVAGGCLLNLDGSVQRGGRRQVLTPWRMLVEMTGLWRWFPGHPHFARFNMQDDPPLSDVCAVPVISGAFMVLPRRSWQDLGGLDERLFLHGEDLDLCLRILKAGGLVLYCAQIALVHQKGSSDIGRFFVEWHKTRSIIRYFFKHFSDSYPAWSLTLLAAALWARWGWVVLRQGLRRLGRRWRGGKAALDSTPATAPPVRSIEFAPLE